MPDAPRRVTTPAPLRPDPDAALLVHDGSLALAWNAPLAAVRRALAVGVFALDVTPGWLHARLLLADAQFEPELADQLRAHPPVFPRAVPFPLAWVDDPDALGAIGFVTCRHDADAAAHFPPTMHASARDVLAWLGETTQQSLRADLDVPETGDGGSVALGVLIAGLLAAEPDLLPDGWGADADAHRFAATGGFVSQPTPNLVPIATATLAAKMRTLRAFGYRTLFVVADEVVMAASVAGLEIVALPPDPARALAELRGWFITRLSLRRRLARLRRRHWRAALACLAIALAFVALSVGLRVWAQRDADVTARGLVAEAAERAHYADYAEVADLLRRAIALSPDSVLANDLAAAEARAKVVVATAAAPFAQIEPAFVVDAANGEVFGSTPTTWTRWSLRTGETLWSIPREQVPVTFMAWGAEGVALLAQRSGRVQLRRVRDGAVLRETDLGMIPAAGSIDVAGSRAVIAGEDGVVVWQPDLREVHRIDHVPFALDDAVLLAPGGNEGAVVHADGTATVFDLLARRGPPRKTAIDVATSATGVRLLDARGGCAWHVVTSGDLHAIVAWDVFANRELRRVALPPGVVPLAGLGDERSHAAVVFAQPVATPEMVSLVTWPDASPDTPRTLPLPRDLEHAGPLAWAGPRRIAAFTLCAQPLPMGNEPTFAGRPFSYGTLLPIDLDHGIDEVPGCLLSPTCAAADPAHARFVTGCADGMLHWWSASDLRHVRTRRIASTAIVGCWFDSGRLLVTLADGRLLTLPADGQGAVDEALAFPTRVGVAAFDPTCRRVLVAPSPDWPIPVPPPKEGGPWIQERLSPGQIATDWLIQEKGRAWLLDLKTSPPSLTPIDNAPTSVVAMAVLPSGAIVLSGAMGSLDARSASTPLEPGTRLRVSIPVTAVSAASDATVLALGDTAGHTHVVDAATLVLFGTQDPAQSDDSPAPVTALAWPSAVEVCTGFGLVAGQMHALDDVHVQAWHRLEAVSRPVYRGQASGVCALLRLQSSALVALGRGDRAMSLLVLR